MGQSFIGRYAKYKAVLTGTGANTPTLKRVEFGYSGSLPSQYRTFAFDPAGNIIEKKIAGDSSTVTETRTYNDLNQLTQNVIDDGTTPVTWTYTHDTNGNMTSKTDGTDTYTYVWNVDNQLEEVKLNAVTLVEYVYDSGSRLIQRTENGTTTNYVWDGWDLVREDKTGAVTSTTKYLVPEGEVLAFERDGEMFYLHGDALSSTQLITDENGDQVARFVYGAWGEELHATDNVPGGTECRFVGGLGVRTDPVTGLIYMRHRWYSVEEQRFISRDPIGLQGSSNLYRYPSNPTTYVDPSGLDFLPPGFMDRRVGINHPRSAYPTPRPTWAVTELALSVMFEPADWLFTAKDIYQNGLSPWHALGLLPIIPGVVAKYAKNGRRLKVGVNPDGVFLSIEGVTPASPELINQIGKYIPIEIKPSFGVTGSTISDCGKRIILGASATKAELLEEAGHVLEIMLGFARAPRELSRLDYKDFVQARNRSEAFVKQLLVDNADRLGLTARDVEFIRQSARNYGITLK